MASNAIVPPTGASDQCGSAPPTTMKPHELAFQEVAHAVAPAFGPSNVIISGPPNLDQPHLVAKPATTTNTLVVPRGTTVTAASKVLDPNLKSRLAKLRTTLIEARHTKSGALVRALGQVMCFMLPKQTIMPAKLVNVYGILAHDVRGGAAYGTCIMQDGNFNTFSFPVMCAAVERMHDDMYSTRCPQVRLAKWLEVKCLPTSDLDGEIKISVKCYNDVNAVTDSCGPSDVESVPTSNLDGEIKLSVQCYNDANAVTDRRGPPVTPRQETNVLVPEGTHVRIQQSKHVHVFGILTHDVTVDLSYGTCIMAVKRGEPASYKMYSLAKLLKAVGRLKLNVHLTLCPSSDLDNLLAFEQRDKKAMHAKIQQSAAAYALESMSGVATALTSVVGTKLTIPLGTNEADVKLADKDAAERSKDDETTIAGPNNEPEILINDGTYVCMLEDNHPDIWCPGP
jgi:hypothetical protein